MSVSRAVLRYVLPGERQRCMGCNGYIRFQGGARYKQVICNVYDSGTWTRVEHWHEDCYDGRYGDAQDGISSFKPGQGFGNRMNT